ncbi:hypothetical protein [Vibrio sp. CAU 1672]|uniref:hypothetical protein n=1 Tax=Vibrio sp. CAU 1672 TaxID=3032594 RepID=UPI0023DA4DDD|nr:hypothetical protein [Vibrio sp. CAU 1672]MDF2152810.1 hypothetical protein [Vibrio sp. CAU 1672]
MRLIEIWQFLMSAGDYRRGARLLSGRSKLDVVFISNVRDEEERALFFPAGSSHMAQVLGPRMHINGVAGQVCGFNFTAEEMYSRKGRKHAKQAFVEAVKWAQQQGAKVVLLAASTKRLFGHDGVELKKMFPEILFTIGDNGTAHLLCSDVDRGLEKAGFANQRPRILVIGTYGILGSAVCRHLHQQQHDFVGFGANPVWLEKFARETNYPTVNDLNEVGKVDMVVTCTHGAESKLTVDVIEQLRRRNRKLLVVDVAEPANLERDVYNQCSDRVVRQDAGNGYSRDLHYVLGPLGYKSLMLSRGTIFGCFAEAMALYHAIYRKNNLALRNRDWFDVSSENQAIIAEAFRSLQMGLPTPHCFGREVLDFNLDCTAPSLPESSTAPEAGGC